MPLLVGLIGKGPIKWLIGIPLPLAIIPLLAIVIALVRIALLPWIPFLPREALIGVILLPIILIWIALLPIVARISLVRAWPHAWATGMGWQRGQIRKSRLI